MDKVILFGAGAEQGYNLALGSEFSESVVGINTEEMDDAIKEFYGNIEDEWYPVYRETKWKYKYKNIDDKLYAVMLKDFRYF